MSATLDTKDSKPFLRYIKGKRHDSTGIAPIKSQGKLHSQNSDKAKLLNDHLKVSSPRKILLIFLSAMINRHTTSINYN